MQHRPNVFAIRSLRRCPFVRAIDEGRDADAAELAAQPPDSAEPLVVAWLIAEARRHLDQVPPGP